MSNLTISIDDEALRRARLRAMQQGTSLNAVLREFLEAYAGVRPEQENALREILNQSKMAGSRSGGRRWTRDELHERS
jgi:plasmid stability protein